MEEENVTIDATLNIVDIIDVQDNTPHETDLSNTTFQNPSQMSLQVISCSNVKYVTLKPAKFLLLTTKKEFIIGIQHVIQVLRI